MREQVSKVCRELTGVGLGVRRGFHRLLEGVERTWNGL